MPSAPDEIQPTLRHSFEAIMVDRGEEVSGTCQSWSLDNDEPLFVSKIRQTNDGAWRHSNWFFVPEATFPGPDGTWSCDKRGFHDVTARLEGGYINKTDRRLTYGLAGKEMCVFLAYSDANLKIGATSGENTAMGPNEDGVFMNETVCGPLVAVRAN